MNKNLIIALILSIICLTAVSGCSDDKKSSESAEDSVTETASTDSDDNVNEENLTEDDASDADSDNESDETKALTDVDTAIEEAIEEFSVGDIIDNYKLSDKYQDEGYVVLEHKNEPVMFAVCEGSSWAVSSYGHAKDFVEFIEDDCTDISFKKCPEYKYDVSVVSYKEELDGKTIFNDYYQLCEQDAKFDIIVMYTEGFDLIAKELADEFINSIEYTSDFYYPTEPQTFENDFFSVYYQPEWFENNRSSTDTSYEFNFKYGHSDTMDNYLACYKIRIENDGEYSTAEEYASSAYKTKAESNPKLRNSLSLDTDEIFGIPAHRLSYTIESSSLLNYNYNIYYFDHNGHIYVVTTSIPINDDGTVAAAMQRIIDGTTLK